MKVAWMRHFSQSGKETFITVVNYECKAMILSKKKKKKRLSWFHLAKFLLQNKTPFRFGIGLLENCRTDCSQNLASWFSTPKLTNNKKRLSFQQISWRFLKIMLLFLRFGIYDIHAQVFEMFLKDMKVHVFISKFRE